MAAELPASELGEELLCSICLEFFNEAVTLHCGHNFCRACVTQFWQRTKAQACAVCRGASSATDLITNHTLNSVVEKFLKEQQKSGESSTQICSLHGEKLKLFCVDERQLICVICQTSQRHENHKLRPVQEAAEQLRGELPFMEDCLQTRLKKFEKAKQKYNQLFEHLKEQGLKTERQIRAEFSRLTQFLQDEENRIIAELRKEEEDKRKLLERNINKISERMAELMLAIKKMKEESQLEDITFLMNCNNRKRSAACASEDPPKIPPATLIDEPKYVGALCYRVWKKMQSVVKASEEQKPFLLVLEATANI